MAETRTMQRGDDGNASPGARRAAEDIGAYIQRSGMKRHVSWLSAEAISKRPDDVLRFFQRVIAERLSEVPPLRPEERSHAETKARVDGEGGRERGTAVGHAHAQTQTHTDAGVQACAEVREQGAQTQQVPDKERRRDVKTYQGVLGAYMTQIHFALGECERLLGNGDAQGMVDCSAQTFADLAATIERIGVVVRTGGVSGGGGGGGGVARGPSSVQASTLHASPAGTAPGRDTPTAADHGRTQSASTVEGAPSHIAAHESDENSTEGSSTSTEESDEEDSSDVSDEEDVAPLENVTSSRGAHNMPTRPQTGGGGVGLETRPAKAQLMGKNTVVPVLTVVGEAGPGGVGSVAKESITREASLCDPKAFTPASPKGRSPGPGERAPGTTMKEMCEGAPEEVLTNAIADSSSLSVAAGLSPGRQAQRPSMRERAIARIVATSSRGLAPLSEIKYSKYIPLISTLRDKFNHTNLIKRNHNITDDDEVNLFLKGVLAHDVSQKRNMNNSMRNDAKEKERLIGARKRWMIIPQDTWYVCWTLFTMSLIIYYVFLVPVRIAFSNTNPASAFVQGADEWWVLDAFADCVFLVDLMMNFVTIIEVQGGELIVDPWLITAYQLTNSWFRIDVIASIPVSLIQGNPGAGASQNSIAKINRLLRMFRIVKLFRVFRMVRFMRDFEDLEIVNPGSLRLLNLLIFFVVYLHYIASAYWWIASSNGFCDDSDEANACSQAWKLGESVALGANLRDQYIYSFYWAVAATTGIGYDIEPETYSQHIFTITTILVGVFMNALLIGSVPGAYENLDRFNTERKRELDRVTDYLRKQGVPLYVQKSVRSYYEYLHSCDYDMRIGEDSLLSNLPESLRMRVKVSTAIRFIDRIPLFEGLNAVCKIEIILKLTPRIVVPGEHLAVQGLVSSHMFIIKSGKVSLRRLPTAKQRWKASFSKIIMQKKLKETKESKAAAAEGGEGESKQKEAGDRFANTARIANGIIHVAELGPGDCFGENAMFNKPNETSALASDYCDLMCLSVHDLDDICSAFPELRVLIQGVAQKREQLHSLPQEKEVSRRFSRPRSWSRSMSQRSTRSDGNDSSSSSTQGSLPEDSPAGEGGGSGPRPTPRYGSGPPPAMRGTGARSSHIAKRRMTRMIYDDISMLKENAGAAKVSSPQQRR